MLPQFDLPEAECVGRGGAMPCPTRPAFHVGPLDGGVLACERHLALVLGRTIPVGRSLEITRLDWASVPEAAEVP